MTNVEPDAATIARVTALAAALSRPVLTPAEVKGAIQNHPRVDRDGTQTDQADWVQTWNIYAAVAELWGMKAGKVAGDFNFKADDAQYDKGAVMAKCLEMEAHYAGRAAGSTTTGPYAGLDPLHGVVVNG